MTEDDVTQKIAINDRRILELEMQVKVHQSEIDSLRASRHEYGNWLNRHNLEIKEVELKYLNLNSAYDDMRETLNKIVGDLNQLQRSIITQFASVKSDVRQAMWVISLIAGLIIFGAKALAKYFGIG